MLQHILVPTDGSELAARALPAAEAIARAQRAAVTLARVVDHRPLLGLGPEDHASIHLEEWMDALNSDAAAALAGLAEDLTSRNLSARTVVLQGSPAQALLDYEAETTPDLVVMATHGRTGPTRLILGSVADLMVREGSAPLLLIPPSGPTGETMRTALLPLDGSSLSAEALQMLSLLADQPLERVRLLRVVEKEGQRGEATAYLASVARQLSHLELDIEVQVSADPAYAVEEAGERVDVVIMSTHGEKGAGGRRQGHVAEHAARHLGVPIIFVRPGGLASGPAITRFLSNVPVFREVDRGLLGHVAGFAHQRTYPKDEAIVRQGQIGVGFFVIRSGQVEVLQDRDGRPHRLRTLGPGEVFGEIALVERITRTATVRALEPTTCVALTGWTLRTLLEDSPEAMRQIHSLVQQRLGEQAVR